MSSEDIGVPHRMRCQHNASTFTAAIWSSDWWAAPELDDNLVRDELAAGAEPLHEDGMW